MPNKEELLNEIEALDNEFEASLHEEPTVEEEISATEDSDEQEETVETVEEVTTVVEDEDIEEIEIPKIDNNEKSNRAFAQMRVANKELTETVNELLDFYGFKDVNELKESLRDAKVKKEAKAQGITEDAYKKILATEDKIKQLEETNRQHEYEKRVLGVRTALDSVCGEFGLDEKSKIKLINTLDKEGYTIDDLIASKNVSRLFKSVASEISKTSKKVVDTEPLPKASFNDKADDIDKLLDADMKEYARKRGYSI